MSCLGLSDCNMGLYLPVFSVTYRQGKTTKNFLDNIETLRYDIPGFLGNPPK